MENISDIEIIEQGIYYNPSALLLIKDINNIVLDYLPYSVGIEIECDKGSNYDVSIFKDIPNIIDVNVDSYEQRYRIPNGINGLICLYEICQNLLIYSNINYDSGIHLHIDCSNWKEYNNNDYVKIIHEHKETFLKELDTWEYKGSYNRRNIGGKGNWIAIRNQTLEFRICEMTFDYNVLIKRIIHASKITTDIKRLCQPTAKDIIANYKDKLNNIGKSKMIEPEDDINNIILNRNL